MPTKPWGELTGLLPAERAAAITPDDTDELPFITRGIYVGTGGDVTAILVADTAEILFKAVPTGTVLPVAAKQVLATGTDAEDLVALA